VNRLRYLSLRKANGHFRLQCWVIWSEFIRNSSKWDNSGFSDRPVQNLESSGGVVPLEISYKHPLFQISPTNTGIHQRASSFKQTTNFESSWSYSGIHAPFGQRTNRSVLALGTNGSSAWISDHTDDVSEKLNTYLKSKKEHSMIQLFEVWVKPLELHNIIFQLNPYMMEKVMELEHQKKLSKLYKNKRFLMNKLIANILW